jgi:hypothetical protein
MSVRQRATFMLAAALILLAPSALEAMFPVKGPPIQPPERIALKFDALIRQFSSEQSGYSCYAVEGGQQKANCLLVVRCSMTIVGIQKDAVDGFGINFGGEHFLGDQQCLTGYFFSQIVTILETLNDISIERAREVVSAIDRDPHNYGRCDPTKLGTFAEGSGGMTYGRDDETYGSDFIEGRRIVKIFCWQAKQT